jgi:anti-sigma regulatory factor (Ser/Thr protein kinase)
MATESHRVEITFQNHAWLHQAVAAAVAHIAQRAGLTSESQQDLAAATLEACANTFRLLPAQDGTLGVAVEHFQDRVEVTLEHHGEALPSAGLETFAGLGGESGDLSGLMLLSRVDRVLYNTENGLSRMKLVKYLK